MNLSGNLIITSGQLGVDKNAKLGKAFNKLDRGVGASKGALIETEAIAELKNS